MKIVFGSECCVDGCYKKAKNGQFCKAHFELFLTELYNDNNNAIGNKVKKALDKIEKI